MDQDYVVTSGAADDPFLAQLMRRIDQEHPGARELNKLAEVQSEAGHRLWLDERAGMLLYLQRNPAGAGSTSHEDRVTLYRIPVRSAVCDRLLADLAAPTLARLDAPEGSYQHPSQADHDLGVLVNLFRVQVARLRAAHTDPDSLLEAVRGQIARARGPQEAERREAFLSWYRRRTFGNDGDVWEKYRNGNDGGVWEKYRKKIRRHAPLPEVPTRGPRERGRPHIFCYYEFRTVGRRLTDEQIAHLRLLAPRAQVTPDRMVLDHVGDPADVIIALHAGGAEAIFAGYFDAGLYFEQSGWRTLWFRLPAALASQARPLARKDAIRFLDAGPGQEDDLLLELDHMEFDAEMTYWRVDPTPMLGEMLPLRDALAAGDLRALYIAHHAARYDSHIPPPPVKVPYPSEWDEDEWTPELHALHRFLELDGLLNY